MNWRFYDRIGNDTKKRFSKKIETTIHSGGKITLENTNWTFCLVNVLYIKTKEWHEVLIGDQTSPPACVLLIYDIFFFNFQSLLMPPGLPGTWDSWSYIVLKINSKIWLFEVSITILSLYKARQNIKLVYNVRLNSPPDMY